MGEKGNFSHTGGAAEPPNSLVPRFTLNLGELPLLKDIDECAFALRGDRVIAMSEKAKSLLSASDFIIANNHRLSLGHTDADSWLTQSLSVLAGTNRPESRHAPSRQLILPSRQVDYVLTLVNGKLIPEPNLNSTAALLVHTHNKSHNGTPGNTQDGAAIRHPWKDLGLTPSETEIARLLLDGLSVIEIAKAQSVSREGVRFHIKGLLSKTQCNRQSQLVAKLARLLWNPGQPMTDR